MDFLTDALVFRYVIYGAAVFITLALLPFVLAIVIGVISVILLPIGKIIEYFRGY